MTRTAANDLMRSKNKYAMISTDSFTAGAKFYINQNWRLTFVLTFNF